MVWLSGLLPDAPCVAVFEEMGERLIPASSIWRQTQQHGERLQTYVQHQHKQVSVERVVLPDALHDHDQRKALSMDGGMVNIRGEGWRELKVGTVFDVETRLERNPQTRQLDAMAPGVNVHYTAVPGSKSDFTPSLWALAVKYQLPTARERALVGDGAACVWTVAEAVCPDGRPIVDWFHAVQHLAEAATVLYPADQDPRNDVVGSKPTKIIAIWGAFTTLLPACTNETGLIGPLTLKLTSAGCSSLSFEKKAFRLGQAQWKAGSSSSSSG